MGPIECVAVTEHELPDKLALRSPISFAERMNGVELAHVVGRPITELGRSGAHEVIFLAEFPEELVQGWDDLFREGKEELP